MTLRASLEMLSLTLCEKEATVPVIPAPAGIHLRVPGADNRSEEQAPALLLAFIWLLHRCHSELSEGFRTPAESTTLML